MFYCRRADICDEGCLFFFYLYGDHRDLHVLPHSFPTRRSSVLAWRQWYRAQGREYQPSMNAGPRYELFTMTLAAVRAGLRSEEHTSELQSLMRISYAVFCLKKKKDHQYSLHCTTKLH